MARSPAASGTSCTSFREIGAVHDARELLQRAVIVSRLVDERLEEAATALVAVRVARAGSVETYRPLFALHRSDLSDSTNRNTGSSSMKRRTSQAVAIRFTRALRRVTHFTAVLLTRALHPGREGRARPHPPRR